MKYEFAFQTYVLQPKLELQTSKINILFFFIYKMFAIRITLPSIKRMTLKL